jgi:hypothetical protein
MPTVGVVERVVLYGQRHQRTALARIDTGAHSNSLDRDLAKELGMGPVVKTAIVKSAIGSHSRPVVMLEIRLAGVRIRGRFTLADRTRMKYPVLIGRNILRNGFLIDPNKDESGNS